MACYLPAPARNDLQARDPQARSSRGIASVEQPGDMVRNRGRRCPQRFIDMNIPLSDPSGSVAKQRSNCQFGVAETTSHAGKCVAQDMRNHAFQASTVTNPVKNPDQPDKMPVSPVGRKEVTGARVGLSLEHGQGRSSDDPALGTGFCRREVDRMFFIEQPGTLKTESFKSAEAGQQKQTDHG